MSRRCFSLEGEPIRRHPKPKHPFSFLVWGGISRRGRTPLIIFNGNMDSKFYQEEILKKGLLPFVNAHYPRGHRFYQDNDPKHKSKSTVAFMEQNGINWWPSPPESPDLNPIENLWAEMKKYISSVVKPMVKADLEKGLHEFWERVTVEKCNRYIDHIKRVMPDVIRAEGGPTRY